MSTLIAITFAVWLLWAALFCLGLCAAAARPIPVPASLRTRSAVREEHGDRDWSMNWNFIHQKNG